MKAAECYERRCENDSGIILASVLGQMISDIKIFTEDIIGRIWKKPKCQFEMNIKSDWSSRFPEIDFNSIDEVKQACISYYKSKDSRAEVQQAWNKLFKHEAFCLDKEHRSSNLTERLLSWQGTSHRNIPTYLYALLFMLHTYREDTKGLISSSERFLSKF